MRVFHGAPLEFEQETLVARFARLAQEAPDALLYGVAGEPDDAAGEIEGVPLGGVPQEGLPEGFVGWTRREAWTLVRATARSLAPYVNAGDHVAIIADPHPRWKIIDLAIQSLGCATVPIYTVSTVEQAAYMLDDARVQVVFVGDDALADRFADAIGAKRDVVMMGDHGFEDTYSFRAFLTDAAREPLPEGPKEHDVGMATPALVIYTSGTTGEPKGVVLRHRNLAASSTSSVRGFRLDELPKLSSVAFLPLAHIAGYMAVQATQDAGGVVVFSNPKRIADDLGAIQPQLIGSVPRIYERMVQRVHEAVADAPKLRQAIFRAAERTAIAAGGQLENGGKLRFITRVKRGLFEVVVYKKLRTRLGLAGLAIAITGAAAVRPSLLHFFQGMGAPIVEAYGLSETTAVVTGNPPDRFRAGSIGIAFPGVSIGLSDDGEIHVQGPHVFEGYLNKPDATKESLVTIDGASWLATGDLATATEDGFLRIIDRKKEIEVLDTGKNVAPLHVEETLKAADPLIADALAIGSNRSFIGALIQPDFDLLCRWAEAHGIAVDPAQRVIRPDPSGNPMTYEVAAELVDHPDVRAHYERFVASANDRLATHEKVRAFRLIPQAFTVDRGELTPTFKKKRAGIRANHEQRVEALFA